VAGRTIYQGIGLQLVDDKGRVAIPAPLRNAVIANSAPEDMKDGPRVTIAVHPESKCLIGYDRGWADIEYARSARREDARLDGTHDYNALRRLSGAGEEAGFDASGRFVLAPFPRFYAGLKKYAFFYGAINYFEIWDPATLVATEDAPEVMVAAARFFMAEKGVTL
jgi:MraZ protein